jgi:hypothetical protein
MGPQALETALNDGVLRFLHDRHLLAWPQSSRYKGIVPFIAVASIPSGRESKVGFTQMDTADLAMRAMHNANLPTAQARRIASLAGACAVDFGERNTFVVSRETQESFRRGAPGWADAVAVYHELVGHLDQFPIPQQELARLEAALRDPKRSPLAPRKGKLRFTVMANGFPEDPGSQSPEEQLSVKQLAMLNLVLSDRFLEMQAALPETPVLHTEPMVESVLAARSVCEFSKRCPQFSLNSAPSS